MTKIAWKAALSLFVLFFILGCEQPLDCGQIGANPLRAGFYYKLDSLETDTIPGFFTVVGIGRTDSVYNFGRNISVISLPLSPFSDSCSFVLSRDSLYQDTLTFNYKRELQLVSQDCGFITTYTIAKVRSTKNGIDSLALINDKVNTSNDLHLKIYL